MIEILSHTTELIDNQIDMRIGIHTVRIITVMGKLRFDIVFFLFVRVR